MELQKPASLKQTISKLNDLQNLINLEKINYRQAIENDQKFEEVKVIYLKIKDLEHKADELMRLTNSKVENKN